MVRVPNLACENGPIQRTGCGDPHNGLLVLDTYVVAGGNKYTDAFYVGSCSMINVYITYLKIDGNWIQLVPVFSNNAQLVWYVFPFLQKAAGSGTLLYDIAGLDYLRYRFDAGTFWVLSFPNPGASYCKILVQEDGTSVNATAKIVVSRGWSDELGVQV